MGDPRLLAVAQQVTDVTADSFVQAVQDLRDTLAAVRGVGLAAPQIGIDLAVVLFGFERIARYPDAPPVPVTVLVNPVIEPLGDDVEEGWEGCLSVPGLRGVVPRYRRIRYVGLDEHGGVIDRTVEGFHARVVQHECDHLYGRLFPTRMTDLTRLGYTSVLFPELTDPTAE
jgi:peptide deformylase